MSEMRILDDDDWQSTISAIREHLSKTWADELEGHINALTGQLNVALQTAQAAEDWGTLQVALVAEREKSAWLEARVAGLEKFIRGIFGPKYDVEISQIALDALVSAGTEGQ